MPFAIFVIYPSQLPFQKSMEKQIGKMYLDKKEADDVCLKMENSRSVKSMNSGKLTGNLFVKEIGNHSDIRVQYAVSMIDNAKQINRQIGYIARSITKAKITHEAREEMLKYTDIRLAEKIRNRSAIVY